VSNALCSLCKFHLRHGAQGCLRLRTCGHEVHTACFNDLLQGGSKSQGFLRSACPQCGECWAEWALKKRSPGEAEATASAGTPRAGQVHKSPALALLLGSGMPSRCITVP
ncbi:unnamed protein product, partial [Polarella glacialis]